MDKDKITGIVAEVIRDELTKKTAQEEEKAASEREAVTKLVKDTIKDEMVQRKWFAPTLAPEKKVEKGLRFARFLRGMIGFKGDQEKAFEYVTEEYGDGGAKALSASIFEAGGAIVPPMYSAEIIELLRPATVVRVLGAVSMPMNSGTLTIPKQTVGGTAHYVGENVNVPTSEQRFGQLSLSAKKLLTLTPISNDLIRDSSPAADVLVRNDLIAGMSAREDLAFIRDDGTGNKPKGLRHWAAAAHVYAANVTTNLVNVTADLARAIRQIEESNVPMLRLGWIFTPRIKWYLMSLRDGNGNLAFEPEMRQATLLGIPFRTSTQIPNNLGVGTESEIYLADFGQAIIGENTQLIVSIYEGGTYHDGTTIVSGISADQTIVTTLARHDFAIRHDQAVSVITGVTWGA